MVPPTRPQRKRRLRTRPRQVYLSEAEDDALDAILARRECTFSELVRAWVLRVQAREEARRRSKLPTPSDPRQTWINGTHR